ncbi:hypothetical protein BJI67_05390 [Acidihalobacter aeolianus]|uniref:Uncharacterized protein n=1 Tax=Acidihalobacter aeolianus TaxID=2792603 RepID=A0A1D8K6J9_9GAMM|nr:helix-turn-helix domain-containing protein [Acidihalobacter aeolianus]AOV16578.1 hypothetical protein BJI67_05390 [Acidihalobacter aeolianus]
MNAGDITIRRIEREYFVVQSDGTGEPVEARGPFKTVEEAQKEHAQWVGELEAVQAAQKPVQDAIEAMRDAYLRHPIFRKIANRIDRETETGKLQERAERAKKIRAELADFEYAHPPIQTEPQASGWMQQSTVKPIEPTPEQIANWRKSAKSAANAHRHAKKNRMKVPKAAAARKAGKAANRAKVLAMTAQGMTNGQIADKLDISERYVRQLRNEKGRN